MGSTWNRARETTVKVMLWLKYWERYIDVKTSSELSYEEEMNQEQRLAYFLS